MGCLMARSMLVMCSAHLWAAHPAIGVPCGVEEQEEGDKGVVGWGMRWMQPPTGHQLVLVSILLVEDVWQMHLQPVVEQDELWCVWM